MGRKKHLFLYKDISKEMDQFQQLIVSAGFGRLAPPIPRGEYRVTGVVTNKITVSPKAYRRSFLDRPQYEFHDGSKHSIRQFAKAHRK